MRYSQVIKYLESFANYETTPAWPYKESLKLERIKGFLAAINNPQEALRCIHVAGTKGKGSTCAFIAYILRQAGFRVGLYTSPHLSDFRERIRILQGTGCRVQGAGVEFEGMISQKELSSLVEKLRPKIEKYNQNSKYGPLTFFEVYTALAFVYFKEKKTDFTVLETGLGGRLDATNVVHPLVAVITPISYEHTDKLGNTLREIAGEKAGIIKKQGSGDKGQETEERRQKTENREQRTENRSKSLIVVSAMQKKEARDVIVNKCKQVGAKLCLAGRYISYRHASGDRGQGSGFSVKGTLREYPKLRVKLLGEHQLANASLAIAAVEALNKYNIHIGIGAIRKGLYNTLWPGRCEVAAQNPRIILDGAQNIASAEVLKKSIRDNFKYQRLILILGISSDKDIRGICNTLGPLADKIILTQANSPRATNPATLAAFFPRRQAYVTAGVKEALVLARGISGKQDLILITGSLFVVGEARKIVKCRI